MINVQNAFDTGLGAAAIIVGIAVLMFPVLATFLAIGLLITGGIYLKEGLNLELPSWKKGKEVEKNE